MISDRFELGEAALDGQISDLAASCVEADRLQSLIRPLAQRCDRLARSWLDHPTPMLGFGLTQASQCLHQALINLEGVTGHLEPFMTTARSASRSCANDPSPSEAEALPGRRPHAATAAAERLRGRMTTTSVGDDVDPYRNTIDRVTDRHTGSGREAHDGQA